MPDELPSEFIQLASRVARAAHRSFPSIEFDDFRQELLIAAWRGIPLYDPKHGATLRTYIRNRLNYAVVDVIRQNGMVSRAAWAKLTEEERDHLRLISLDALTTPEESMKHGLDAVIEARTEHGYAAVEASETLRAVMNDLPEKHSRVLRHRYFEGRNLAEIGVTEYGVTESRVCQRVRAAQNAAVRLAS